MPVGQSWQLQIAKFGCVPPPAPPPSPSSPPSSQRELWGNRKLFANHAYRHSLFSPSLSRSWEGDRVPSASFTLGFPQAEERRSARMGREDDLRAEEEELRMQEEKRKKKKRAKGGSGLVM